MPSPYIEYHIDFDEDNVLESGEEVSGDVNSLILTRGKDIRANRAPAATLAVNMRDNSHKYTPINTASPLYPFQLPGPRCRLRMAYPYDSFTDDNSTALNGRALPKADDQTKNEGGWDAWVADSEFVIESNHVELTATADHLLATLDFGTPNVRLGADIKMDTHTSYPWYQPLFVFRKQDDTNYNFIYVHAASAATHHVGFGKVTAGSFASYTPQLLSTNLNTTIWDKGETARVEAQIIDDEVIVWVNDFVVAHTEVATSFPTETEHGIGGYQFTSTAVSGTAGSRVVQWDNFGGWNTMFTGRTDQVDPKPGDDPSADISAWDDFERLNRHPVFRTVEGTKTAKQLVEEVIDACNVLNEQVLPDASTNPSLINVLIADDGETLLADFAKAMSSNGLEELYQIQDDDVGFVWIDGRATYRYEATDHRDSAPHDTHHATWEADSSDSTKPYISRDPRPRWQDGKDIVENEIYYKFARAAKAVGATVWLLEVDDNPDFQVAPATTLSTWMLVEIVALDSGNAIGKLRNPIPTTDYTIFENADGTGVDYLTPLASETGTVSIAEAPSLLQLDDTGQNFGGSTTVGAGSYNKSGQIITVRDNSGYTAVGYARAISASNPDGDGTRVNITDWPEDPEGAGFPGTPGWIRADADFDRTDTPLTYDTMLSGAYIVDGFEGETAVIRYLTTDTFEDSNFVTSAQLKADQTVESNPTAARANDATSQTSFGRRRVDHQTKYIDTWAIAKGRADARLAARKDERERFIVNIHNATKANLMEILYRDVSDRIRINYSGMGMTNRNYWIESYVLSLSDAGKRIAMEFTLSKVV